MSNDLKIKDINNKLQDKLEQSSWNDFLVPYIQGIAHKTFMNVLLDDMQKGIKFQPGMKDWFTEYFRVNLKDLKLVVVTPQYELPKFINECDNETFHLVVNKTKKENGVENSHTDYWRTFNEIFFEYLNENSIIVPIMFIDTATYSLSKLTSASFKKYFLPEYSSTYWDSSEEKERLINNINNVLKINNRNKINW